MNGSEHVSSRGRLNPNEGCGGDGDSGDGADLLLS